MSVTRNSLNVLLALAVLGAVESARPLAAADRSDPSGNWNTRKLSADQQQGPLARLIRTPDTSSGLPPYALTDQTGKIQRYVEPVPGIDLESYVGYVVVVGHDTGRTLLASQLDLPGGAPPAALADRRPSITPISDQADPRGNWQAASAVKPAQYQQPVMGQPVMMQQPGMMQQQGMMPQGAMPQGVVPIDQSGQMMMGQQPCCNQPMMAQGVPPVYIDGPMMMEGGTCQAQMPMENAWVVPGQMNTCPQPCAQCQPTPMYQQVPCQTCPQPCAQPCPQPCAPPPPPPLMYSIFGEVLWLHPTGVDMVHAQQQNGTGGAGTVPWGDIGRVDPEYNLGFRVGGEIRFGPCESIFASYMFYQSDSDGSLSPPVIPGGDGAVGSLVQHPGAELTASDGPVNATYDIDFQVGDLAYRQIISCRPESVVSVFLGARYGHLDQDFTQTGTFGGGNAGAINTSTDIKVNAAGPMVGIDGEHGLGKSSFSVYGRGLVAALTGEFKSTYRMNNQTTDELLAESIWSDDRIIPMLDYELGIAWTGPNRHFRLAVGYMATYWFNAVTTPVFVDAVQADNYVNVSDTIAFDGLVGHVEFRW